MTPSQFSKSVLIIIMLGLSHLLLAQSTNSSADVVVAQVGNKKILLSEFNRRYQEVRVNTLNPPPKQIFLEDLVRYYIGVQEAEKMGIRNDAAVQERIQQEIYKGLLEKVIGQQIAGIKVNEEEMKAWYKNNPEIRTSHILIEYKTGAKPEEIAIARKRAQEIYSEVTSSKRTFEELVRLYTDDPLSKQAGGDVGWQTRLTLVPAYYEAALKMRAGEIHGIVETSFGFHIIKLTGRRTYENATKRNIRTAVYDEKRKQIFNAYFEKAKKSYAIKVNANALQ